MEKRKVLSVKFHDLKEVVPGVIGQLPDRLPSQTKNVDVKMYEGILGIELHFSKTKYIRIVPYANVQMYEVEEEITRTKEDAEKLFPFQARLNQ